MTMRQISVPGTTDFELGKQFGGIYVPSLWDSIYALYLLGTDYHVGAPSAGSPMTDLSGNSRTLTQTGSNASAGFKTLHFIGNGNVYLNTPFTANSLAADTTGGGIAGEFGMHFIGVAPVTESNKWATNQWDAANWSSRYVDAGSTATFDAQLIVHDGVEADTPATGNPVDAGRSFPRSFGFGLRPADHLIAYQPGLKQYGVLEYPNDNFNAVTSQVGGGAFRMAFSGLATFNFKVSLAAFFNRQLNPREHALFDIEARRVLSFYGLAFA